MGQKKHVGEGALAVAQARRFVIVDVQPRPPELAGLQGRDQGFVIDQCAASGVHDDGAVFHQRNSLHVQKPDRLRRGRAVQGQDIAFGQQAFDTVVIDSAGFQVRRQPGAIVIMNFHAQSVAGLAGQDRAHPACR
jgi:RecA/RadA recombinase